ncbi:MAG: hypothetical protein J6R29_05965 [Clostridia bacterium]|nr:hypothetical protein [Clostridia bacterium]
MILAKNETLIKEWKYGTKTQKKLVTDSTLIITDKRIISETSNKNYISRSEIPVNCVKSVSGSHKTPSKLPAYLLIGFGIPLCLVIVGIFMIMAGLERLKAGEFELCIATEGLEGEPLEVGYTSGLKSLFNRRKARKAPKVKVRINNAICHEIVETIGSIIIENK